MRIDIPLLAQEQQLQLPPADAQIAHQFSAIAPATAEIVSECNKLAGRWISVFEAPHGTGKSTWLPYCLLNSPLAEQGPVCIAVASGSTINRDATLILKLLLRIDDTEPGAKLGQSGLIGHGKSNAFKYGSSNRLVYATHDALCDLLTRGKAEEFSAIVLDDASETSESLELVSAIFKSQQHTHQPFRVVVAGSNVVDSYVNYFGRGEVFVPKSHVSPPPFHVEKYSADNQDFDPCDNLSRLPDAVTELVARIRNEPSFVSPSCPTGDIVVFLPSIESVEQTVKLLNVVGSPSLQVYRHHACISPADEAALLESEMRASEAFKLGQPTSPQRVIVTDGSEPTLRFNNLRIVIDSGLATAWQWDSAILKRRRRLVWNSQAGCLRRYSQVGRVQDGAYFQLYSPGNIDEANEHPISALSRSPLSKIHLRLMCAGISNPGEIQWLVQPRLSVGDGRQAMSELESLHAVADGRITPLGVQLSQIRADTVGLSRCLEAADAAGCAIEVASFLAFSKVVDGPFLLSDLGAVSAAKHACECHDDLELCLRVLSGWFNESEQSRGEWTRSHGLDENKLTKIEEGIRRMLIQFRSKTYSKGDPLRREFDFQRIDRVRLVIAHALKDACYRRDDRTVGDRCTHIGLGPQIGAPTVTVDANSAVARCDSGAVLVCVNRVRRGQSIVGTSFVQIPRKWVAWLDSPSLISVLGRLTQPLEHTKGCANEKGVDEEVCQVGKTVIVSLLRRFNGAWSSLERCSGSLVIVSSLDKYRTFSGDYALVTLEQRRDDIGAWEATPVNDFTIKTIKDSAAADFDAMRCHNILAIKRLVNIRSFWIGECDNGQEFLMVGAEGQFRTGIWYRLQYLRQTSFKFRIAAQEPLLSNFHINQIVFDAKIANTHVPRDGRLRGYSVEICDGVFAFLAHHMAPAGFSPEVGQLVDVVFLKRRQFEAPQIVHFGRLKRQFPLVFAELERNARQPNDKGVEALIAMHYSGNAPPGPHDHLSSIDASDVPLHALEHYLECVADYSMRVPRFRESLVRYLESNAPVLQKCIVAVALGSLPSADGADEDGRFLQGQLRSNDAYVRCYAVVGLLLRHKAATDEFHSIISDAVGSGIDTEFCLVHALATRGANALPDVVRMANQNGSRLRLRASELLVEIAKKSDGHSPEQVNRVFEVAAQLCDHNDPQVRLGAAKAIRRLLIDLDRGSNESNHGEIVARILNQISTICETRFVRESSYRVRRQLIWAMPGEWKFRHLQADASRQTAFLQQGLSDASYSVRIEVQTCLVLTRKDSSTLAPSLGYPNSNGSVEIASLDDLASTCPETRSRCFLTLVEGEATHLDLLSHGLRSDDQAIVLGVLEAIDEIGDAAQLLASELFELMLCADDLTILDGVETAIRSVYRHTGLPGMLAPTFSEELGAYLRARVPFDGSKRGFETKLTRLFNLADLILNEGSVLTSLSAVPKQSQRVAFAHAASPNYGRRQRAFRLLARVAEADDWEVRNAVLSCLSDLDARKAYSGFLALSLFNQPDQQLCQAIIDAQSRLLEYRGSRAGKTQEARKEWPLPDTIATCLSRCGDYEMVKAAVRPSIADAVWQKRGSCSPPYGQPEPQHLNLWNLLAELSPWFNANPDSANMAFDLWKEAMEFRQRYDGEFDRSGHPTIKDAARSICKLCPDDVVAHLLERLGSYTEGQVSCVAFHASLLPVEFFGAVLSRFGPEQNSGDFIRSNQGVELLSIIEQTGPPAAVGLASVAASKWRFSPHQHVFALELLLESRVIDSQCVTHLEKCLKSGSSRVKVLTANVCSEYGRVAANALPTLKKLKTSWRRPVRKAAAAAVAAIEEDT